jgi:hypothetical protein
MSALIKRMALGLAALSFFPGIIMRNLLVKNPDAMPIIVIGIALYVSEVFHS